MPAEQAEHLVFSPGWDTPGFSHGEDVTMAAFNVLVQWYGFQPHASGFVPLSKAEFGL